MINICLTKFTNDPWSSIIMEGFFEALNNEKKLYTVEKIFGYPQKKYDLLILIGIRSIVKRNLDKEKILPFCSKLIDMGDSAMDPRKNFEDAYFYFIPSKKKLFNHYHYLPKFLMEKYLYPAPKKNNKLNLYIDHFHSSHDRNTSIRSIKKIFNELSLSEVPLNIFYHTSKGIELNRSSPEIPKENVDQCAAFIPFEEITKYYRQTDVFFPTHRESQGMLAQEIAACGGITVMQEWMYPKEVHHQFPHIIYKENQKIDFNFIKQVLEKHSKTEIRQQVLKHCSFNKFKEKLQEVIHLLFNIK